jgi:hypothetical protein
MRVGRRRRTQSPQLFVFPKWVLAGPFRPRTLCRTSELIKNCWSQI